MAFTNKMPLKELEDTVRYAGLLLAPVEGFGLQPRAFFALPAKKDLIMLFWPILLHVWCPVVTLVTFSSNLSNFFKKSKNPKKIQTIFKFKKIKKIKK